MQAHQFSVETRSITHKCVSSSLNERFSRVADSWKPSDVLKQLHLTKLPSTNCGVVSQVIDHFKICAASKTGALCNVSSQLPAEWLT